MIQSKKYRYFIKVLFIVGLLLYNFQGTLFPVGSKVCMTGVTVVMIMEIMCFFANFRKIVDPVFFTLFLLLVMTFFAYFFSDSMVDTGRGRYVDSSSELLAISYICLFVFTGYHFYKTNILNDKDVVLLLLLLLAQSIISFFYMRNFLFLERGNYRYTNNWGYLFASLLPYIFYIKKKQFRWPILFTIFVFVLLCAKRGAIVVSFVFIIYYFFVNRAFRNPIANFFSSIIFLSIVAYLFYNVVSGNEYLQMRMESTIEGNSSNRDMLYSTLLNAYWGFDNIYYYLFGKGLLTSVKITGFLAHNDWLELLLSNGLIGACIYLLFFIQLLVFSKSKAVSSYTKHIIVAILIIWFTKTLFSMAISDVMFAPIPLLLGVTIARNEVDNKSVLHE